ncbi:3-phenylpropionate/trans-cinnamate dioxygenase ferredoxin subunit [Chitinophaga skermanii]|uniref:3-phenylpropionate/trans-cinnamate dioxygenase ferredoxin subunit n=1 Tax=Chitinophaga skermanii TaxID=331697 RepID=A0A327QAT8_9BACT|nr:Rieske 2Fe-2S domain-containing protein [Chitinophaga skermanii]RAJ01649.1 3-phenylpropionate/trans-cinnamate dioxygenase ferredoxin subunit [Chitinophaga skermanii]
MGKEYNWHALPALVLAEKEILVEDVAGKKICITRYNGQLYAFAYKCPHAGAPMNEGYVDAQGQVICPLHKYKFNIRNGYNSSGEGYCLKTYPVEEREGILHVGFDKSWMSL